MHYIFLASNNLYCTPLGPWGSLAILPALGAGDLSSNLGGPITFLLGDKESLVIL